MIKVTVEEKTIQKHIVTLEALCPDCDYTHQFTMEIEEKQILIFGSCGWQRQYSETDFIEKLA